MQFTHSKFFPFLTNKIKCQDWMFRFIGVLLFIVFSLQSPAANVSSIDFWVDEAVPQSEFFQNVFHEKSNDNRIFHLISHGRSGELFLDGKWKTPEEISIFLQPYLSKKTQLNIYGCEFAKGEKGKAAVNFLQKELGVKIAASENLTGKNGDWFLENGNVNTLLFFENYNFTLQCNNTLTDCDGDGVNNYDDLDDDNDGIPDLEDGCGNTNVSGTIGLTNAVVHNSNYALLGTNITYSRTGTTQVQIEGYDALAQGEAIKFTGVGGENGVLTTIFTNPVTAVYFKIADFDQEENYTVNVYDENDALYDLTVEGLLLKGSQIEQTGNAFEPSLTAVGVSGNDPASDAVGSLIFYFPNKVSKIELLYNHPIASTLTFIEPQFCITDTDSDGILDHLDLDSDDDGCYDAQEAGHLQVVFGNGKIATTAAEVGDNGLDNDVENDDTKDAIANYIILETNSGTQDFQSTIVALCEADNDRDGIANINDADDDNDGIPDVVEICGVGATDFSCLTGCTDCDPGGDDDLDLILNYQDPDFCTLNANGVCEEMDKDGDGIPNHLDLDSDNDGITDVTEAGGIDLLGNGHLEYPIDNDPTSMIDTDNDGLADEVDEICLEVVNETRYADAQTNYGTVVTPEGAVSTTVGFAVVSETIPHSYITLDLTDVIIVGAQVCVNIEGDANGQPFTIEVSSDGTNFTTAATGGSGNATTIFIDYCITHTSEFRYVRVTNIDNGGAAKSINIDFVSYFLENIPCNNVGTALVNKNSDGDGFPDFLDLDSDDDGITDLIEVGGIDHNGDGFVDAATDTDMDGFADVFDPDDDGIFGIDAGEENQPLVKNNLAGHFLNGETAVNLDRDLDNLPDHLDIDSDNDGLPDLLEAKGIDIDGDGRVDIVTDDDEDGYMDIYDPNIGGIAPLGTLVSVLLKTSGTDADSDGKVDATDVITYVDGNDLSTDSDEDGLSDHLDLDADNDGIPDLIELGGHDLEGDGRVDISLAPWDSDGDGLADLYDINSGGSALLQTTADTDGDGKLRSTGEAMTSGGGGAGLPPNPDEDDLTNHLDKDSDNDGILDVIETGATDSDNNGKIDNGSGGFIDTDKDGLADAVDGDVGNDFIYESGNPLIKTIPDDVADVDIRLEYSGNGTSDSDGDDVPNFLDIDSDNDGIYDNYEAQSTAGYVPPGTLDADKDGLLDAYDSNTVNASALQNGLTPFNFNVSIGDPIPDYLDLDSDGDGIPDEQEAWDDVTDGDSQYDNLPPCDKIDTDGDGLVDCYDGNTVNASAFTWAGNPANDVNGAPSTAVFTDQLNKILPSNNPYNPGEPDFRTNLNACTTAKVYYGISEASPGTTTNIEYDSISKYHFNNISSGVIRATAFCAPDGDGWNYFYNPLEPENYLFGIRMNYSGGTVNASALWGMMDYVEVKLAGDRTDRHVVGTNNATFAMERDWRVAFKDTLPAGATFDVKFYFTQAEMDSLSVAADAVEANASGVTRTFAWIEKEGGVQNADITESGVTGENDITVKDLQGINESNPGNTEVTAAGNGKNFVKFTGLTEFSGGTAVIKLQYSAVLPVELSSFKVEEKDCAAQISWTTETEEDFDYFEVQKSADGLEFKTIKTLQGRGGNFRQSYIFKDENISNLKYYRLKIVDLDGSFEFSKIVSLVTNCEKRVELNIFPNPIHALDGKLNVEFFSPTSAAEFVMMDALGRTVKRLKFEVAAGKNASVQIDISDLPLGIYSLRQIGSGQIKLFKMTD